MKLTKQTKRIFACGLAFALVVTGSEFPSNTASAATKAAKLSKSKASVTVGKTVKLSVKNATKKVKWSTSNKKIAKVSKTSGKKKATAVIKGVKAGTATITAKVGNKKLKCKVTVKAAATNISSVSVDTYDSTALVLKLKKATALNASDVKVAIKTYKNGSFNSSADVKTLTTSDQKTYRLYLSKSIGNGSFVKVTVGKYTKTIQNKQTFYGSSDNETILVEKDSVTRISLGGYFNNAIGSLKYSLKSGTLPAGLSLSSKRAKIKGIPTATGNSTIKVQATDELGRKTTTTLTIKVYDDTSIASADQTLEYRLDDYTADRAASTASMSGVSLNENYQEIAISPLGGSGKYTFALAETADVAGVKISTDTAAASAKLYIPYGITEGTHTYTVNITDAADAARTATATITVKVSSYYNISGTVADIAGNLLEGEALYFISKDSQEFYEYIHQRSFIKYDLSSGKISGGNTVKDYMEYGYKDTEQSDDGYSVYNYSFSAKVGPFPTPTVAASAAPTATTEPTAAPEATATPEATASAYTMPTLDSGKYTTELPAGEYIVKIYSPKTGILYQMEDTVTVNAADAENAITSPVRFTNVSATATYSNSENPVANDTIYFETKDEQYLSDGYSVKTDYQGKFTASLPEGTYTAYIIDEYGERQYFGTDITVADTALELTDFKLSISRYAVEGTLTRSVSSYNETTGAIEVTPEEETYRNLYIYFPDGTCKTVTTDKNGQYKVYLEGGETAKSYTVRAYYNSILYTVGTIAVAQANQTIDGQNPANLSYDFTSEAAKATDITIGTEAAFQSTGNNDIIAKFTPTEDGTYTVTTAFKGTADVSTQLLKINDTNAANAEKVASTESEDGMSVDLTANTTYYVKVIAYKQDSLVQANGNISLTVAKGQDEYSGATELTAANTAAAPLSISTSQDQDSETYVKLTTEANKKYTITLSNTTVGVEEISYYIVDSNGSYYNSDWFTSNSTTITISSSNADTYYIRLRAYDDDYDRMAATLKLSVTVEDLATTSDAE